MSSVFDTTTTDDLTDAQIQAAISKIGSGYIVAYVRRAAEGSHYLAILALARLMRDHPELFEKPVDPDVLAVQEAMAKRHEEHNSHHTAESYRNGDYDDTPEFLAALDLLRAAKGGAA